MLRIQSSVSSYLGAFTLVLSLLGAGAAPAATPEEDAIHEQRVAVEKTIAELSLREVSIEEEILTLEASQAQLHLELGDAKLEHERLNGEAKALALEARGQDLEADFARRQSALRLEIMRLNAKRQELQIEKMETVEPLKLESKRLSLRDVGGAVDGDREAYQERSRRRYELTSQIADLGADIERRKNEIQRELAAVYHNQQELGRDRAVAKGDTENAERYQEQAARAAEKRAELEIESVFLELRDELYRQSRELSRLVSVSSDQQERQQLLEQLRILREDQARLHQSRATFRNESELQRIEHQLGGHLRRLESARGSSTAAEATHLEDEIQRLRAAATELVKEVMRRAPDAE